MKLDLHEVAHSPGMLYNYEINDKDSEDIREGLAESGVELKAPVRGKITLNNTGNLILARGDVTTSMDLECIRCLTHFALPQSIHVEEQFPIRPEHEHSSDWDDEDDVELMVEADLDMADDLYKDGILDLTELIRQNLIVSAPMHAVCDEACSGLCLHCGKNLNEGPCECPPDSDDEPHPLRDALKDWQV